MLDQLKNQTQNTVKLNSATFTTVLEKKIQTQTITTASVQNFYQGNDGESTEPYARGDFQ